MKTKHLFTLILWGLLLITPLRAQYTVDLFIPDSFTEGEFQAFALANNLQNTPRIFYIDVLPLNEPVYLEVTTQWARVGSATYQQLFWFKTKVYNSQRVYNDMLGTTVKLDQSDIDGALADEIRAKGKPTGSFNIYVKLFTADGVLRSEFQTTKEFINPSQTISISMPDLGSTQEIGSVLALWDQVEGIDRFEVKINYREDPNQSLEEALDAGTPLADNVSVGTATQVDLRTILQREWLAGQEIVFQVRAVLPAPGGNKYFYSQIINFFIRGQQTNQSQQLNQTLLALGQTLSGLLPPDLANQLLNGDMGQMTEILLDGQLVSTEELAALLLELQSDPDRVIRIIFEQ